MESYSIDQQYIMLDVPATGVYNTVENKQTITDRGVLYGY